MQLKEIFQVTKLILHNDSTYEECINLLFREKPPSDHNFLARVNTPEIAEVIDSDSYHKNKDNQRSKILFSIIVPTYQRSFLLKDALSALTSQKEIDRVSFEIIVVDDGSTDHTKIYIQQFIEEEKTFLLRYVRLHKNCGVSYARNVGILYAVGKFICFTDDDCIVPEDWLIKFLDDFHSHPEISGSGGWHPTVRNPSLLSQITSNYALRSLYPFDPHQVFKSSVYSDLNRCGNTANLCYKKTVIENIGGFNHYFHYPSSEDWELKIRLHNNGHTLLYNGRTVKHRRRSSLVGFFKTYLVRGWARFLIAKIHPSYESYNFSTLRSFANFRKEVSLLFKNTEALYPLPRRAKIILLCFSLLKAFAFWEGKFWFAIKIYETHRPSARFSNPPNPQ